MPVSGQPGNPSLVFSGAFTFLVFCRGSAQITVWDAMYCTACGYATQHFASSLHILLFQFEVLPGADSVNYWIYVLVYFCVYLVFFLLFARNMAEEGSYGVSRQNAVSAVAVIIFITYFMSILTKNVLSYTGIDADSQTYSIMFGLCQIYALFVCFLFLWVQRVQRQELQTQRLLEKNEAMWKQRQLQYRLSKENMDMMNRKYHDMKHQIAAIRRMEGTSEERGEFLNELQKMTEIYDSNVDTGNEALDTILMEKGLYCKMHQITWNCVADGEAFDFMDVIDLYTLIGNALDNAIESVEKIRDEEKRVISVNIEKKEGFGVLRFKNCFEGELKFHGSLPVTSKGDRRNHGYGLKSIRQIVEKYQGTMSVKAEASVFFLYIVIPVAGEAMEMKDGEQISKGK
ncbi:MAG: GHKL domain-containing protein [Clostridiales bacterium]|nr:GHKL domain-containing protein [Clostridiales bacterium]